MSRAVPAAPVETDLEVMEARARRLAGAPAAAQEGRATSWLAEFTLGGASFAFPLDRLRAALPLRAVSPVPLAPTGLIGLLRWDGRLLCAWSLAALMGAQRWHGDPVMVMVVEYAPTRLAALDGEQVPRAVPVPAEVLERARPLDRAGLSELVLEGSRTVTLIDPARLLQAGRGSSGA